MKRIVVLKLFRERHKVLVVSINYTAMDEWNCRGEKGDVEGMKCIGDNNEEVLFVLSLLSWESYLSSKFQFLYSGVLC